MKRLFPLLYLLLLCLPAIALAEDDTPQPLEMTIHNEVLNPVDTRIFGHFLERYGPREPGPEALIDPATGEMNREALRRIEEMGSPITRYPGGTYLEKGPLWTTLIDGAYDRAQRARPAGSTFGYDEFLNLCEAHGTEPLLVTALSRPLIHLGKETWVGTQEHAAALVAYCNAPVDADLPENLLRWARLRAENGRVEPWGVKYWQVGNEPFLAFWWPLDKLNKNIETITRMYVDQVEAQIQAMRAVDPSIEIFVETHLENNHPDSETTRVLRERLGDQIDYVTYHLYQPWQILKIERDGAAIDPLEFTPEQNFLAASSTPGVHPETGQTQLRQRAFFSALEHGYKLALTEWNWNGWFSVGIGSYNRERRDLHAAGLGAAGILHAMIRAGEHVKIANQSMQVGTNWAITGVHLPTADETHPIVVTPTGLATTLLRNHHGNALLQTAVENQTFYTQPFRLAAIAPKDKVAHVDWLVTRGENSIFIHTINRDFHHDRPMQVRLEGFERKPGAVVRHSMIRQKTPQVAMLDHSMLESVALKDALQPDATLEFDLPAQSLNIIEVRLSAQ
ncbi:MAG: hypothetical protein ACFBZ8_07570 [Opitutales bacterium]